MAAATPTRLEEIKAQLSADQLRYLAERVLCRTDKEAADNCNIIYSTVLNWPEKQTINEAVRLLQAEGVEASREILRRKLVKAAQTKAAGLDSRKEAIKQAAATEILDRFHGKPTQQNNVNVTGGPLVINLTWGDTEAERGGIDNPTA